MLSNSYSEKDAMKTLNKGECPMVTGWEGSSVKITSKGASTMRNPSCASALIHPRGGLVGIKQEALSDGQM